MARRKVTKVLEFLRDRLQASGLRISKMVLFGSHAKRGASSDSDIDVVVVSEDFENKDIFARLELVKAAEIATIKKFVVPMDIVLLTPEEFESETCLVAQFAKEGKTVYAA